MPRIVIDARGSFFLSALSADGTTVPVYDDSNHGAALTLPASLDGGRTLWVTDGYSAVDATFTSGSWQRTDRLSFVNSTDIAVQLNSADVEQPGAETALPSTPFGRGLLTPTDAAEARTLLGAATRVEFNVKDYGAVGDGTTEDTTAIQAALNAASAAGNGKVYLPPGRYLSKTVYVYSNTTLAGAGIGRSTILRHPETGSTATVRLEGSHFMTMEDLTVDNNAVGLHACVQVTNTDGVDHILIRDVFFTNVPSSYGFNCSYPISEVTVKNCRFENVGGMSVYFSGDYNNPSTGISITGNRFKDCGHGVQLLPQGTWALGNDTAFGIVTLEGNIMGDFKVPGSASATEINGVQTYTCRGNILYSEATRGLGFGQCKDVQVIGNTVIGQNSGALQFGSNQRVTIAGNVFKDNASVMWQDMPSAADSPSDIIFANNVVFGSYSGLSTPASNSYALSLVESGHAAPSRWLIVNNVFKDWKFLTGAIRIGGGTPAIAHDVTVRGNLFYVESPDATIPCITISGGVRVRVVDNDISITRDLASADNTLCTIITTPNENSSDLRIVGNDIRFTGTTGSAPDSSGIGSGNTGLFTVPGVVVRGNTVRGAAIGIRLHNISPDLVVEDNDLTGCTTPYAASINRRGPTHFSTVPIGSTPYSSFGTDRTLGTANRIFIGSLWVGEAKLLTGAAVLNGSVTGTDKWCYYLANEYGTVVAQTAPAGVTTGTANTFQPIPFTSPYSARKGRYFVGVQSNGTTDRLRAVPANTFLIFSAYKDPAEAFGATLALSTPSTFTGEVAPIAYLY